MTSSLERNLSILIRLVVIILAGLGLYLFFKYFWPLVQGLINTGIKVMLPLFVSYLIALILHPVIGVMERRLRINRSLGAIIALLVFLAVIGGLLFLLVSNLIKELLLLYQQLSTASQGLGLLDVNMLMDKLRLLMISLQLPPDTIQQALQNYQQAFNIVRDIVNFMLGQMYTLVASLPHNFLVLIVTIIASFFFARDLQAIKENLIMTLPGKWRAPFKKLASVLNRALRGYLKAELLLILFSGLQTLIGLSILGVNYAYLLAIVATVFDLLPIIGIGTLFVPWALWMLLTGSPRLGIGLLVLYGIIVLIRQLLEPRIIARNIGLHPLTTLISIYIGLMLLGFWGLVLGPAVVIAYKAFAEEIRSL